MGKKIVCIVALLAVCLVPLGLAVAASAEVIDYNDLITNIEIDGTNQVVTLNLPFSAAATTWTLYTVSPAAAVARGTGNHATFYAEGNNTEYRLAFTYGNAYQNKSMVDLGMIPDQSEFVYNFDFFGSAAEWGSYRVVHYWVDSDGVSVASQNFGSYESDPYRLTISYDREHSNGGYLQPGFQCRLRSALQGGNDVYCTLLSAQVRISIPTLIRDQEEQHRTNTILAAVEAKLGQMVEESKQTNETLQALLDEITGQPDKEKQEAQHSGQTATQQVQQAVPDKSGDLLASVNKLSSAMGYTGLQAKLPLPRLYIPRVANVVPEIELMPAQDVDFAQFFAMIPDNIMALIRALCDIGLVVFCFREVYATIGYFVTMSGGDKDNE